MFWYVLKLIVPATKLLLTTTYCLCVITKSAAHKNGFEVLVFTPGKSHCAMCRGPPSRSSDASPRTASRPAAELGPGARSGDHTQATAS